MPAEKTVKRKVMTGLKRAARTWDVSLAPTTAFGQSGAVDFPGVEFTDARK